MGQAYIYIYENIRISFLVLQTCAGSHLLVNISLADGYSVKVD